MPERLPQTAAEIYQHAVDHYNDGGWDVIVECWTVEEIQEKITEMGLVKAWLLIKDLVDIWADRQADAINSAF